MTLSTCAFSVGVAWNAIVPSRPKKPTVTPSPKAVGVQSFLLLFPGGEVVGGELELRLLERGEDLRVLVGDHVVANLLRRGVRLAHEDTAGDGGDQAAGGAEQPGGDDGSDGPDDGFPVSQGMPRS